METRNPFSMSSRTQTRAAEFDMGLRAFMLGMYNYMASALVLTGIVALVAVNTPAIMSVIYMVSDDGRLIGLKPLGWLVTIAPLILAFALGMGLNRMSVQAAQATFWSYAVLMGLSLSSI